MHQLCKAVRRFVQEEVGATAVEYAVLVALIIAVSIAVIGTIGEQTQTGFDSVSTDLSAAGVN